MTRARDALVWSLWHGRDPFADDPARGAAPDHQGWNSGHPYLARAVDEARPGVVVEIGVWKGGSALTLAERIRERGLDGVVVAVDTWLGAADHWLSPDYHADLGFAGGYPTLYRRFAANVLDRGLADHVLPLPLDGLSARDLLAARGIVPDVVHVDAGHGYASVLADLAAWWPLIRPGGVLVGDDYAADRSIWPEVAQAFDDFFAATSHDGFESGDSKCYVRKPTCKSACKSTCPREPPPAGPRLPFEG